MNDETETIVGNQRIKTEIEKTRSRLLFVLIIEIVRKTRRTEENFRLFRSLNFCFFVDGSSMLFYPNEDSESDDLIAYDLIAGSSIFRHSIEMLILSFSASLEILCACCLIFFVKKSFQFFILLVCFVFLTIATMFLRFSSRIWPVFKSFSNLFVSSLELSTSTVIRLPMEVHHWFRLQSARVSSFSVQFFW